MKKTILIILLFLGGISSTIAQVPQLPKQVKVGKPEILKPKSGTYKRDDLEKEFQPGSKWGTKKTVPEFWVVRSDRNRNPVYAEASGTSTLNTMLAFNQKVVICEVKGDRALVYEDNKMESYPQIPNYAKCIGWVDMENLLLWDACPTDQRGVQYKALIAINLNKVGGGKNEFKGSVYKDPVNDENPQNLVMDMRFFFILKETRDGKRVLLCENPTVFGSNLYGWVDDNAFTRWNQRACLEPNWDQQYSESHKGQEVGVFADKNLTSGNKVTSWEYGKSNGDKDQWFQYRMAPSQLRFPIIEKVDEQANWIHCTSYADRRGKANMGEAHRSTTDKVKHVQQMRKQLNVILAVEATTEMRDVLPAIKRSLAKCSSFSGTELQIKAGVVLYRGVAQGANGLETVPLTGYNDPLLLSKLESGKANGRLSARERDVALALAIERATDPTKMGFKKDQNNLLLVVGSRGAPDSDRLFTDPKFLDRLSNNNIQVMSIQVTKNQTGSWVNFNDQMVDLIKANVSRQYEEIKDELDFKYRIKEGDGYNFNSKFKENVLFAQIRYPKELGKPMSANDVTKYIDNGINEFVKAGSKWEAHFEQSLGDIQFDPAFLKRYLGAASFEKWKEVKAISAFDGYTRRKDMSGGDYWHYILYLSNDELQKLLDDLKPAYEVARKKSDDRKPYIDAMRSLVKTHLGQATDKGIDNMDEDQLQELIYGLDVHTDMTNIRKLKDIADPRVVTTIEYQKMLAKFTTNYERLLQLFIDGYTYRTKLGDDWYYWIPIEDLP